MRRKRRRQGEGDGRAKATGVKDNHETGRKVDMLMGEKEVDNMLSSDTAAEQNVTERNRRKSYSEIVSDRRCVKESEGVCGGLDR